MAKKISDIVAHSDKLTKVEERRARMERYLLYAVSAVALLGVAYAGLNSSVVITLISWFVPSGGHAPVIGYARAYDGNDLTRESNQSYPAYNVTYVRFNVSYNDSDTMDWHALVVCNGTSGPYTYNTSDGLHYNFTCTGHGILCYNSLTFVTDDPLYCDFHPAGYANQTQNFTAYVVDSGGMAANKSGTFAVDRPPILDSIVVTKI